MAACWSIVELWVGFVMDVESVDGSIMGLEIGMAYGSDKYGIRSLKLLFDILVLTSAHLGARCTGVFAHEVFGWQRTSNAVDSAGRDHVG